MSAPAEKRIMSKRLMAVLAAFAIVGAVMFVVGLFMETPLRAWQAYFINWVFWSSLAQGAVVFAAILDVTNSSWGRPMKRIAESFAAFLPISFLLYLPLWFGMEHLYAWSVHPLPGSEWWLSKGFVFIRDLVALAVLYGLSLYYVRASIRPDLGSAEAKAKPGAGLRGMIAGAWRGEEDEIKLGVERRRVLAPAVIIAFAFIFSLIAYDLVMSMSPTWYSTLFGAYFWVISVFSALALVALFTILIRKRAGILDAIGEAQFHDLGKLMFGFTLLSMDFFWSQFLIIWYGNIPEETGYILIRAFSEPWVVPTWIVLFGAFVAPFFLLLRRGMKTDPRKLFLVSLWILVMVWLEKFVLVAPSVWPGHDLPLGIMEILLILGYGGIFFGSAIYLLDRVPALPVTDPIFTGEPAPHHVLGEPDRV